MPRASEQTSQVKVLNANWTAGPTGTDGRLKIMIVTAVSQQHTAAPSPAAISALTLAEADTILLWDPTDQTPAAAKIVGTWPAMTRVTRAEVTTLGS